MSSRISEPTLRMLAYILDDYTSNILVTNNIVYGIGSWGFVIHGGDGNTFSNNIFNITNFNTNDGLYQDEMGTNYGMANNSFRTNIIYSSSSSIPSEMWNFIGQSSGAVALLSVSNNLYYDSHGTLPTTSDTFGGRGPFFDSSPTKANPLVSPSTGNYQLGAGSPAFGLGFVQINQSLVGPYNNGP
jgi:hypothetical protein